MEASRGGRSSSQPAEPDGIYLPCPLKKERRRATENNLAREKHFRCLPTPLQAFPSAHPPASQPARPSVLSLHPPTHPPTLLYSTYPSSLFSLSPPTPPPKHNDLPICPVLSCPFSPLLLPSPTYILLPPIFPSTLASIFPRHKYPHPSYILHLCHASVGLNTH